MLKPILCTCCGALLTKPVFIKMLPYGHSCAKKQGESMKKPALECVAMTVVRKYSFGNEVEDIDHLNGASFSVVYNGKTYRVSAIGLTGDDVVLGIESVKVGRTFSTIVHTVGGNEHLYKAMFSFNKE